MADEQRTERMACYGGPYDGREADVPYDGDVPRCWYLYHNPDPDLREPAPEDYEAVIATAPVMGWYVPQPEDDRTRDGVRRMRWQSVNRTRPVQGLTTERSQ